MELNCTCVGEGAKWHLTGALNTVILLSQGNLTRLAEEIKQHREKGEEVPKFKEMALEKLKDDLATADILKDKIEAIPICKGE